MKMNEFPSQLLHLCRLPVHSFFTQFVCKQPVLFYLEGLPEPSKVMNLFQGKWTYKSCTRVFLLHKRHT